MGRLKELPGVFSQGEDLPELERNIRDADHLVLEHQQLPVIQSEIRTPSNWIWDLKRREFLRDLVRRGGNHDLYSNPGNGNPLRSRVTTRIKTHGPTDPQTPFLLRQP